MLIFFHFENRPKLQRDAFSVYQKEEVDNVFNYDNFVSQILKKMLCAFKVLFSKTNKAPLKN